MSVSPVVRIVDLPEEIIDHILETIHARRFKYGGGVLRSSRYRRPQDLVRASQGGVDTIMSIRLTCRLFARIARPWAFRRLSCRFDVHRSSSPSRNIGLSEEIRAFYQTFTGHVRCLEISFHALTREDVDLEAEQWVDDAHLPLEDGIENPDPDECNASPAFEQFLPILHSMDNLEILILHARDDAAQFDPFHRPWQSPTKLANIHSLFLDLKKPVSLDRLRHTVLGDRPVSRLHFSSQSDVLDIRNSSTSLYDELNSTEVLSIRHVPPKAVLPWSTLLELTLDYKKSAVVSAKAAWRSLQEWQSAHPDVCLPLRELSMRTGWWLNRVDIFRNTSSFLNLLSLLTSPEAHGLAKPGLGKGLRRLTVDGNPRQIVPDSTNDTVPRALATLSFLFPALEDLGFYIEEDEEGQSGQGPAVLVLERCKFRRLKIFRCEHDFLKEWLGWELENVTDSEDGSEGSDDSHRVEALRSRFPQTIAPLFPRLDILRSRPNIYYTWWARMDYAGMVEGQEATLTFVRPASPPCSSDGSYAAPGDVQNASDSSDDGMTWTMSFSTTDWPSVDSDGVLTSYWREVL